MKNTAAKILRVISRKAKNEIFTTRQMLSFGLRGEVDQVMYSLVKCGDIHRVAWGVFVIAGSDLSKITDEQIAMAKASAFKREIVEHATDAGERFGIHGPANKGPTYSTRARSTSFLNRITGIRIYFKGVSARKFVSAGSVTGDVLRSLWNLTKDGLTDAALDTATIMMNASHRAELPEFADLMPEWLHEHFHRAWSSA